MRSTLLERGEIWQPHRAHKRPDSADPTVGCTLCSDPAEIRVVVCWAPGHGWRTQVALIDVAWSVFELLLKTLSGSCFASIVVSRSNLRPQWASVTRLRHRWPCRLHTGTALPRRLGIKVPRAQRRVIIIPRQGAHTFVVRSHTMSPPRVRSSGVGRVVRDVLQQPAKSPREPPACVAQHIRRIVSGNSHECLSGRTVFGCK
jgi:hypothetical protein